MQTRYHEYTTECDYCGREAVTKHSCVPLGRALPSEWRAIEPLPVVCGRTLDLCPECCTALGQLADSIAATVAKFARGVRSHLIQQKLTLARHVCYTAAKRVDAVLDASSAEGETS